MTAVLDGLDLLAFTSGLENMTRKCAEIYGGLSWLSISLDLTGNNSSRDVISHATSRCLVRALHSQEEAQIAVHTWEIASGVVS